MTKYTITGFADEMCDDLEGQLKGHKALGLKRIDLRHINGKNISELTGAEVAEVFRLLHVYKIRPYSIGSPIGKISLDCNLDAHFELARRILHMAHVLGAKVVRVFSFYPRKDKEFDSSDRDVIVDFLTRLAKIANFYRLTVCIENERGVYGESPERARELIEAVNLEKLRCVFDMGNYVHDGYDPIAAYDILADYVFSFHIKEVNAAREMVLIGDGDSKIAEILKKHYDARSGGEIFLALEPHLANFTGLSALSDAHIKHSSGINDRALAYTASAERLSEIIDNISNSEEN